MAQLMHGDCLTLLPTLKPASVQFAFLDLPYNITACAWDIAIDPAQLWAELARVLAPNAIVAATATLRFAAVMLASATVPFKYDLVWHKTQATGFLQSKRAPLRAHEHVLIFGTPKSTYNAQMVAKPQGARGGAIVKRERKHGEVYAVQRRTEYTYTDLRHPTSIVTASTPQAERGHHPTQKPISLISWLVNTYSNAGDTVLDPTMGSGSAGVVAGSLGREFIGIERDAAYFAKAQARIGSGRVAVATGAGIEPAACGFGDHRSTS